MAGFLKNTKWLKLRKNEQDKIRNEGMVTYKINKKQHIKVVGRNEEKNEVYE